MDEISGPAPKVAEFFAGIGLARLGLERAGFEVTWANDIEQSKYSMYEGHFRDEALSGSSHFEVRDVASVTGDMVPDIDLAWSSFPCTDLSLAGGRAGLAGAASGTFYHFTRVLDEMGDRKPAVVAVENVHGLATSHGGDDMVAAIRALNDLGYSVDVLAIDARRFVPQSRPRLFMVGVQDPAQLPTGTDSEIRPDFLQVFYGDPSLRMHTALLPSLPRPLVGGLHAYVEEMADDDGRWWSPERVQAFVESLSSIQLARVQMLRSSGVESFRTAYRRTRKGVAVWEVRPDEVSGCLRTARGGSSKQAVVRVSSGELQVRWMTPLEYARLMGAGDYNIYGVRDSQVLFGFGDAVCAPAVAWVAENYLLRTLREKAPTPEEAALNG